MEKSRYISLEDAFKIHAFGCLINSGAYFPTLGHLNINDCKTLGMDPVTKELRVGNRNGEENNWKTIDPKDFSNIQVYLGNILLNCTTS